MNSFVEQATTLSPSTTYTLASQPWNPHAYQLKAVKHLLERGGAGLLLDPGLGKTSVVLACQQVLKNSEQAGPMLVLAPLRVCQLVWPNEAKKWIDFHDLKIVVLHGKHKDALLNTKADVYVLNYEGLEWFLKAEGLDKTAATTLVADESTRLKNSQGKRFKLLRLHLNRFTRRWILTGTPTPNTIEDIWAQVFLCDAGLALGRYITHFRNKFFQADARNPYLRTLLPGAADQIHEAVRPYMLRMAAEDYLEMPELVPNEIVVQLPPDARRVYEDIHDDFISMLGEGAVLAANAAVAGGKCLQICNGALYTENPAYMELHDMKIEALKDLLAELGGKPALIFYQYTHDRQRILKALEGSNGRVIGSGVPDKDTATGVQMFNSGQLEWLLTHAASAGHGLNLQECSNHVVWFGLPWDLELYDQANKRVYRQGQPNTHVFIHHIVAERTIEQKVLRTLRSKDKSQRALFAAMLEVL